MKKFQLYTTVSFILSLVSFGLTFCKYKFAPSLFDLRIISGLCSVAAFFILSGDFKKFTGPNQFAAFVFAMASLGMASDDIFNGHFFNTGSLLLAFFAFNFRMLFRSKFAEVGNLWIDPVLYLTSITIYVYGNSSVGEGWQGWVFPVPVLVFSGMIVVMGIFHGSQTIKIIIGNKLIHESGKAAPDFSLMDFEGNQVRLSDFSGKRNILLMFVRSAWCPSCHIMLRTYSRNSEKFKTKNVMLLAIGPNTSDVNKQMAIDLGIDFKVLSDETQKTAMAYRVFLSAESTGEKEGMALPASFLIDKNGIIRYTTRPDKIGEYFAPETIFPILESLN